MGNQSSARFFDNLSTMRLHPLKVCFAQIYQNFGTGERQIAIAVSVYSRDS